MSEDQAFPSALEGTWGRIEAEAAEFGAEYREKGWDVHVVHPGDVTAIAADPFGLDVLAPGSEYEALESVVESVQFDRSHVYRTNTESMRFFVTVFEATDEEIAVVVPLFASVKDLEELVGPATAAGEMQVHVRPLSDDARVTFTVADQSLFFDTD